MSHHAQTETKKKRFLDIPTAAESAGFSSRHFRRIIEEDRIPVVQIGRKLFIVTRDFDAWKSTRGESRLRDAVQQVDGWVAKKNALRD
jgi:hypothetical protein